jgi:uncharacterized protein (DUF1330 family)
MPRHLSIATLTVAHPAWIDDYVAHVTPMVEARGGRYLTRTTRVSQIEGASAPPQVVLVIEWPSREVAEAFYASEDYRPFREARLAGSQSSFWLVPAEDVGGVARIDP